MNYNISEVNFRNFVIGSGWPAYRNVTVSEMADMLNNTENTPADNGRAMPANNASSDNGMTMPSDNVSSDNEGNNAETAPVNNGETATTPRYDTLPGSSIVTGNNSGDITSRESELMKALYSQLNKALTPYVNVILDEFEYMDSPIYDEDGIDRETVAQLVSRVISLAADRDDEFGEMILDEKTQGWCREDLLNSAIQSLLLSEIFVVRRPRYRRALSNYRYNNGVYNGVNPQ